MALASLLRKGRLAESEVNALRRPETSVVLAAAMESASGKAVEAEGSGSVFQSKAETVFEEGAALRYAAPLGGKKGAALRSLPVLFVLALVGVVSGAYLGLHVAPLLEARSSNQEAFVRGAWQCGVFSWLLGLFLLCFSLSVAVPPGRPEDVDASLLEETAVRPASKANLSETKLKLRGKGRAPASASSVSVCASLRVRS